MARVSHLSAAKKDIAGFFADGQRIWNIKETRGCLLGLASLRGLLTGLMGALIINSIGAGRIDDARDAAAQLLKLRPDFRVSDSVETFRSRSAATRDRILKALQASGLPP